MKKRLISLIVAVVMLFSMLCPAAYADDETVSFDTCTHEWETPLRSGYSITIPGSDVSFSVKTEQCKKCKWYKHVATIFIAEFTYYSPLNVDANGLVPTELATYWANVWYNNFGKNATATKFAAGGGSTSGGGVGRPKGYADDNGTPNYTSSGFLTMMVEPYALGVNSAQGCVFTKSEKDSVIYSLGASGEGTQYRNGYWYGAIYKFTAPVSGIYFIGSDIGKYEFGSLSLFYTDWSKSSMSYTATNKYQCSIVLNAGEDCYFIYSVYKSYASYKGKPYRYQLNSIPISIEPVGNTTIKKQTNITINNNTWNGNIYTDNSTNLTYIYPQYTTVNEKNETVTNISNTPIIYNNETKQYYTYDQTTKNYYYITYNENPTTPTPSPSPTPDPDNPSVTPTPTPTPGGDTGDTTGILAVLVEIRDNMIQGFLDIKAAFVAGFAELSANFILAIENLNLNITNIFNKKFPDKSTPETATPSPSPSPSPSPAPLDPILPETQNLIIPKMNSNTFTDEHGTWIASGSSKYSDVFDFFHAFDRSTSDFWETNASPSYLQIEIPDPENYYVDGYIMRISKFTNRYAKEWTLQGSDDGKTWDDLDTQKDQNLSDLEEHKYPLTLRKAYKYYRLNMSNYASSMCSLSHFNLLGYDAKDVVTPTPAPTNPPSPSPAPDPGTDPTPVPTPGGDSGGNNSSSGDSSLNPFKWLTDLLQNIVEGILKAIWKLITALFGFLLWLLSLVGSLFPFIPGQAVLAVTSAVVIVAVIRIIKFITGR